MSTIRKSITFTEQQENWIKLQIEEGYYTNDSEYIRDLIRQDQAKNSKLIILKRAINEGINSEVSDLKVSDIMNTVEKKLEADGKL